MKENFEKLKKLADAMYYAAQHLTTDASRLHKAMDEYHKFIIHKCKEEPVSKQNLSNVERIGKDLKEHVSNDFEMALAEMIYNAQTSVVEPLVIAAQWKDELIKLAKSKEPISEDLEEAANFYADTHTEWFDADNNPHVSPAFKAGANWQNEQLVKDAVICVVEPHYKKNK